MNIYVTIPVAVYGNFACGYFIAEFNNYFYRSHLIHYSAYGFNNLICNILDFCKKLPDDIRKTVWVEDIKLSMFSQYLQTRLAFITCSNCYFPQHVVAGHRDEPKIPIDADREYEIWMDKQEQNRRKLRWLCARKKLIPIDLLKIVKKFLIYEPPYFLQ